MNRLRLFWIVVTNLYWSFVWEHRAQKFEAQLNKLMRYESALANRGLAEKFPALFFQVGSTIDQLKLAAATARQLEKDCDRLVRHPDGILARTLDDHQLEARVQQATKEALARLKNWAPPS